MHPAAMPEATLLRDCDERRTRRGGPGGQHRNKVETAVVLLHRPTGITAEASERRSQAENRRVAIGRLRLALAVAHRLPPDPAGPSPRFRARTTGGRIAVAIDHEDYPALVAEAFDQLATHDWRLPQAAAALGVSTSQLTRLCRRDRAVWTALGRHRASAGLPPLA